METMTVERELGFREINTVPRDGIEGEKGGVEEIAKEGQKNEVKEAVSKDSLRAAANAKVGIEAIQSKQIDVAQYLVGECYKYLDENTALEALAIVEEFAEELIKGGEEDHGEQLMGKIAEIRAKQVEMIKE